MPRTNKTSNTGYGLTRDTLLNSESGGNSIVKTQQAGVGLYNVFNDPQNKLMGNRKLADSRLWHGVPQLSEEQMRMFEASYTGHQFFFVTRLPAFMVSGAFADTDCAMHVHANNLKTVIERCCKSFDGATELNAQESRQDDGAGRTISHVVSVTKEQPTVSLTLHEFAGLPVKNALEAWLTGIFDYRSQHGNYHGNLGIDGGWCLNNHTMSMMVVQVDPSWCEIQDAAYYCNMWPQSVNFDNFRYQKGESDIIQEQSLQFAANEVRSAQVNEYAVKLMNNRILNQVFTSVYDTTQIKPFNKTIASDIATVKTTPADQDYGA